jgi:SpoVK/Ycf46/Vps4 family AAA+-type ATPase
MVDLAGDLDSSVRLSTVNQIFEYAQRLSDTLRRGSVERIILWVLSDEDCVPRARTRIGAVIGTLGPEVSREMCAWYTSLLVKWMDDITILSDVIVVTATNREEALDEALCRPDTFHFLIDLEPT